MYLHRDYLRTHFHSVLLHRLLVANNNQITTLAALGAAQICFTASVSFLREVVKLAGMDVLHYIWDTCHFMISSSAMILLKTIKQAPNQPGISVTAAYETLESTTEAISGVWLGGFSY